MIKCNGTAVPADGQSLRDYLESAGYDAKRVAVERNGEIVSREDYEAVVLVDGDELEVVRFVGGG